MSRHRNVRSMNYSEEYEGFDDVYGHSVEDDYCVSPSVEQFIYDRNKRQQMSAFLGPEEEIAEEDEDMEKEAAPEHSKTNRKGLNLNDIDQARLQSCLEEVRNVIGDSISEQTLIDAALSCDFNFEKVLNMVLNNATEKDNLGALKPSKADTRKDKDDCSSRNIPCSPNDRSKTQISLASGNSKESSVIIDGINEAVNYSPNEVNNSIESSHMLMKTEVAVKSEPSVPDNSFTNTSEIECHVPVESGVTPLKTDCQASEDISVQSVSVNKRGGSGAVPKSDLSMTQIEVQKNPQLSSDSEEDEFSSLCSLVVHNRKRFSESAVFEHKSADVPPLRKGMREYSTPVKPLGMTKDLGQIESDSEEEDYSSLRSLVVHNRSGSAALEEPSNPIPSLYVPTLSAKKNSELFTAQPKVMGASNQLFEDSDSEDFNFSSLCSLVVCNRSHPSDDVPKVSGKESLTTFPKLPDKEELQSSPLVPGKGLPINVPSLSRKNADRSSVHSKLPGFCNKPGGESDSDTEDEDFSSLCSLVIHNRSSPCVAGTKPSIVSSPAVGSPPCKGVEKERESNPGVSKFIIPPLILPTNMAKTSETVGEKSGSTSSILGKVEETISEKNVLRFSSDDSNQCSEDEDYVIDLCSTVKAMELKKESSFEEEVDEAQIVEEVHCEFLIDDKIFLPYDISAGLQSFDIDYAKISPFGQTLCRKWDCLARIESPQCMEEDLGESQVVAFMFETESPDDICNRLRSTKYLVKLETPNVVM